MLKNLSGRVAVTALLAFLAGIVAAMGIAMSSMIVSVAGCSFLAGLLYIITKMCDNCGAVHKNWRDESQ